MDKQELDEIRKRAEASTPNLTVRDMEGEGDKDPWPVDGWPVIGFDDGSVSWRNAADPAFFVQARADVLRLLAEIERLSARSD